MTNRPIRHRNPNTIWLFDFPSLEGMSSGQNYLLFLSERDINILLQACKDIDRWRSRIFLSAVGDIYDVVSVAQFETWKDWVSTLFNNLGDYPMTNLLLERIAEALEALEARECCPTGSPGSGILNSGSRGAGISRQPLNDYTEGGEQDPPPGFDSWAAYRQHKCDAANDIVLHLKVDLLSLSNIVPSGDTFSTLLLGLVGVLLTPIPWDDLAYLLGLLTVAAFEYSLLAELSAKVQENAEDLVCTLYNSPGADAAQGSLRSDIFLLIEEVTAFGAAQQWMADVVASLTPPDAINRLFVAGPTETQGGDCSACAAAECPPVSVIKSNGYVGVLLNDYDVEAVLSPPNANRYEVLVYINAVVDNSDPDNGSVLSYCNTPNNWVEILSGTVAYTPETPEFRTFNSLGEDVGSGADLTGVENANTVTYWVIISDTPFSVRFHLL